MAATHNSVRRATVFLLLTALVTAACGPLGATPAPTPAPVKVRFAFRSDVANYLLLADAFHLKYPNITVELVSQRVVPGQTQGQILGSLSLTLLKMQGIDAFRDTVPYLPSAQLTNDLLPLDEYIVARKAFPSADFLPGLLDTMKVSGVQIAIPAGVNPIVAYYDAYRFRTAGVKTPDTSWTLNDFLDAAAATNNQGAPGARNADYVFGFCSEPISADPVVLTYLMGGQLVDNLQNPTRPTMNSEANLRAVQWYASLRTVHGVTPELQQLAQVYRRGVYEPISMGRCGVWLGFYGDMRGKAWGTLWLGEPVMMPLPRAQANFNAASVDGYFILRNAAHPQEAWLWLNFLLEHEDAAGAQVPPRRSQIESQAFAGRVTPDVAAVARALPTNTLIVGIGSPQNLGSVVEIYLKAVDEVVRGNTDAKTALAAAQANALLLFGQ
jgi:ABC-type glycerol-3-phosphate transport system substrate-binding protein